MAVSTLSRKGKENKKKIPKTSQKAIKNWLVEFSINNPKPTTFPPGSSVPFECFPLHRNYLSFFPKSHAFKIPFVPFSTKKRTSSLSKKMNGKVEFDGMVCGGGRDWIGIICVSICAVVPIFHVFPSFLCVYCLSFCWRSLIDNRYTNTHTDKAQQSIDRTPKLTHPVAKEKDHHVCRMFFFSLVFHSNSLPLLSTNQTISIPLPHPRP